eukprot:SAG31_NODE_6402_length_2032_cov_1.511123_1_plen_175_part_00
MRVVLHLTILFAARTLTRFRSLHRHIRLTLPPQKFATHRIAEPGQDLKKLRFNQTMAAGTCAGFLQQIFCYPFETVRTRLCARAFSSPMGTFHTPNLITKLVGQFAGRQRYRFRCVLQWNCRLLREDGENRGTWYHYQSRAAAHTSNNSAALSAEYLSSRSHAAALLMSHEICR